MGLSKWRIIFGTKWRLFGFSWEALKTAERIDKNKTVMIGFNGDQQDGVSDVRIS